jgi:hypothetical protein
MHDFYESLHVPGSDIPCCSISDCRNVRVTVNLGDGAYYAFIDDKTFPTDGQYGHGHAPNDWVKVPEESILHGHLNPSGEPIACWYGGRILCFLPASGV